MNLTFTSLSSSKLQFDALQLQKNLNSAYTLHPLVIRSNTIPSQRCTQVSCTQVQVIRGLSVTDDIAQKAELDGYFNFLPNETMKNFGFFFKGLSTTGSLDTTSNEIHFSSPLITEICMLNRIVCDAALLQYVLT